MPFTDTLSNNRNFDKPRLKWDAFKFDGEYVVDEFTMSYDINAYDTCIRYDNFTYNSPDICN